MYIFKISTSYFAYIYILSDFFSKVHILEFFYSCKYIIDCFRYKIPTKKVVILYFLTECECEFCYRSILHGDSVQIIAYLL